MTKCSHCEDKFKDDEDIIYAGNIELCEDCYSQNTTQCNQCDEVIYTENDFTETSEGHNFCSNNCLVEHGGGYCESCSDCSSDVSYSDRFDAEYCSDCYTERNHEDDDEEVELDFEFIPEQRKGLMNTNNRYVGVELEVIDDGRAIERGNGYRIVADGSLNDYGREIVSEPLMNNRFENILKNLISYYKNDVEIDSSCGFHLHVGLKNKEINSLAFHKKLIAFATNNENLFFTILPRTRHGNSYAKLFNERNEDYNKMSYDIKKLYNSTTRLKFIENIYGNHDYSDAHKHYKQSIRKLDQPNKSENIKANYESAIQATKRGKGKYGGGDFRYKWLNFHSIQFRGTIEVRLHTGTFNYNKVKAWTLLWVNLIDYLSSKPLRYIQNKKFNSIDEMIGELKIASRRVGKNTLRQHYKQRVKKFENDYNTLSNYYHWNLTENERAVLYFINQMDADDRSVAYIQRQESRQREQERIENV